MNELLNVEIPVAHNGVLLGTINLSVEKSCMAAIDVIKLTNLSGVAIDYTLLTRDGVLHTDALNQRDVKSVGLIPTNPIIFKADINRFTKIELVIVKREGVVTALAKVYVRGALHLNAMYRGDGKNRIVVDKFTKVTKEMAAWRTPNSRLSSVLKAISK